MSFKQNAGIGKLIQFVYQVLGSLAQIKAAVLV